jgi:hypothetical protein
VEGLFPTVGAAVCRQVGGLAEGLVAVVAAVRPLAAVGAHVGLEGAGARVPEGGSVFFNSQCVEEIASGS